MEHSMMKIRPCSFLSFSSKSFYKIGELSSLQRPFLGMWLCSTAKETMQA